MFIDIEIIKDLSQELKRILEKEDDNEVVYIIHQLGLVTFLIDECLDSTCENIDLKQLLGKLKALYIKINQPRVALSDYFIWRDNYEERVTVNNELDKIKRNLKLVFSKY